MRVLAWIDSESTAAIVLGWISFVATEALQTWTGDYSSVRLEGDPCQGLLLRFKRFERFCSG